MPKNKFNSLDVVREVRELREKLVGTRLANLYDMDKKTYLLKFAKSEQKTFLVIESGARLHATAFSHEHQEVPNVFAVRLRKHIRTKRLEEIRQFGMDRVVDFVFGMGAGQFHLIVELYAAGNIILTDNNFKILILLRSYQQDENVVAVGSTYNLDSTQTIPVVTEEQLTEYVKSGDEKKAIKNALSNKIPYGAPLLEHCLRMANIDPSQKPPDFDLAKIPALAESLKNVVTLIESPQIQKGWIVCKKKPEKTAQEKQAEAEQKKLEAEKAAQEGTTTTAAPEKEEDELIYEDFIPILFKQNESSIIKEFPSFDATVDEFFSKSYSHKVELARAEHESIMDKQLQKVKHDQESRMKGLDNEVQKWNRNAELIEQNIEAVDQCTSAIRASLANRIDWEQLNDYIKEERANGNPLAMMIHKLKLEKNQVTVLLYDQYLDDDEQTEAAKAVDIDITLTAHANARAYYDRKKKAVDKKEKTVIAADKALKSAEEKAKRKMKDAKVQQSVKQIRKPYWFEKFNWFLSSDNYIVVCGRDVQQNELLYKRYLQKGDLYFHADIHGAATVVLKNPDGGEVPPLTLAQAATFSICHSNAWKNKVVTSAYWVHDNQVSKTAPTGEYLTTGSFMIRGKKNFLPHSSLAMGLGILFRLADESVANHVQERQAKWFKDGETNEDDGEDEDMPKVSKRPNPNQDPNNNTDDSVTITAPEESNPNSSAVPENPEAGVGEESSSEEETEAGTGNTQEKQIEKSEESDSEDLDEDLRSSDFSVSLIRQPDATPASDADSSAAESTQEASTDSGPKKKGLSIKERKLLKKQKKAQQQGNTAEGESQQSAEPAEASSPKQKGPVPKQLPRGQKNRQKKREKYAWQDEEDRKLYMGMLGHKEDGPGVSKKRQEVDKKIEEMAKKRQITKDMQQRKLEQDKEQEEIRLLLKDENVDVLTEDDKKKIEDITAQGLGVNLAGLTSQPVPGDILLYAVPVCGPFAAMKDYKYKVKVTPGTEKKGSAIKSATAIFMKVEGSTDKERELIKSLTDQEWGLALISNCKISAPGLASVRGKGKKGKKKK